MVPLCALNPSGVASGPSQLPHRQDFPLGLLPPPLHGHPLPRSPSHAAVLSDRAGHLFPNLNLPLSKRVSERLPSVLSSQTWSRTPAAGDPHNLW
jgi:hypothetical protein